MALFTSAREKRLWIYVFIVWIAIFSTLFFTRPLIEFLGNQDLQAAIFLFGMILIGASILVYSLKNRPGKTEIAIWLGLAAVYLLFFLRLGLPERSHLIEYSVLAIFIYQAVRERIGGGTQALKPALVAFVLNLLIGVIDECIQIFLPGRVFDPVDMLFNGFAGLMAIASSMLLQWIRKKMRQA